MGRLTHRRFAICLLGALTLSAGLFAQPEYKLPGSHIGVSVVEITPDRASALHLGEPRGVEIKGVQENSPAAASGLQAGDVLLTYNTEEILSPPQLGRLVSETPAGRKVKVQYWRSGKEKSAVLVPAAAAEPKAADSADTVLDSQALNVPNIPRMLMLWDNLALGIECEPIDSQIAQYFGVTSGILIRQVGKGYVGEKAGLKAGDVITSIDTRTVAAPRDLISYLRTQSQPGKAMVIQVVRDRKPRTFTFSLTE